MGSRRNWTSTQPSRRQVRSGLGGHALQPLAHLLAADQDAERPEHLRQRVAGAGDAESAPKILGGQGRAHRKLLDEPGGDEGDDGDEAGHLERRVQGAGERGEVGSWTPGGSLARVAEFKCEVLSCEAEAWGKAARSRLASSVAKMVPMIAVPTELPMLRNSVLPEVATPSSS